MVLYLSDGPLPQRWFSCVVLHKRPHGPEGQSLTPQQGETGGDPGEAGGDPGETRGRQGETGGDPGEAGGDPGEAGGDPGETGGDPGEAGGGRGRPGGGRGRQGDTRPGRTRSSSRAGITPRSTYRRSFVSPRIRGCSCPPVPGIPARCPPSYSNMMLETGKKNEFISHRIAQDLTV
ncbi:unnamed protein product [Arctogadus glacialis]